MAKMRRPPPLAKTHFTTGRIIKRTVRARRTAMRIVKAQMTKALQKAIDTPYPPASKPGDPPHKRTGWLHDTVQVVEDGSGNLKLRALKYGYYLESGTRKMKARPFFKPVILDNRAKWEKRINDEIRKAYGR